MSYRAYDRDDLTLDEIDSADVSDGYDWSTFAVLRGSDGLLYTSSDSGCSCNWFGDDPLDVEPATTWQEAVDRAKEWGGTDSEVMALIERLMKSSPAATI